MADRESNVELMRKLYSKLSELLYVDTGAVQVAGSYLSLYPAGGMLLDPTVDPMKPEGRALIIRALADIRLRESWITTRQPSPMSAVYRSILRDKKTPNYSLTKDQEILFNELDKKLFTKDRDFTPLYETFRNARGKLAEAITAIETWQNANPNDSVPNTLQQQLVIATEDYNNKAKGPTVQQYINKHTELQNLRGSSWFNDLQEIFNKNFVVRGNYGQTYFYPTYSEWFKADQTWTKITASARDFEQQTHNSNTSSGAGLSVSWGLWSVGGKYSKDMTESFQQTTISNLLLEFEVLPVNIDFPWMDFGLFHSRAWDWNGTGEYDHDQPISDGKYDPNSPVAERELLPFVPTTLLIARNVKLSADWSFDLEHFIQTCEGGGGSIGWGPFSFGGRSFHQDTSTYKVAKAQGTSVTFTHPQVIGYFSALVPKSPNPDPHLPWGDKLLDKSITSSFLKDGYSTEILDHANRLLSSLKIK
ncbi:hypothetical protein RO575_22680 [Methylomonas sp. MO1]|uniref:hypothetical protein n=1 Tax=Methylomonas sp. MO1 TaxID=3073619 RepID=UPI0028A31F36|nr:hypothetical protein [Methylomonas sp. MO1]MDT4292381.1 hypothetical protein [Methylomonas sp. MO1]